MSTPQSIVIIGGGLAGAKTAEALRVNGYEGSITLIAAEDYLPYERPPLSKEYMAGKVGFDKAIVHPAEWYKENNVTLRQGVRATAIDAGSRQVTVDDGGNTETINYDKLVLATGSAVRKLPIPGADASNVHYLRTVEDSDAIKATSVKVKSWSSSVVAGSDSKSHQRHEELALTSLFWKVESSHF